jgi:uncharacterized membrane protein YjgN (DUF898 family)
MPIFMHRVFRYRPSKPRSTLLKVLLGTAGVLILAFLLVFGVFIGAGMLLFAAVRRLMKHRQPSAVSAAKDQTLDGEYKVIRKTNAQLNAQ